MTETKPKKRRYPWTEWFRAGRFTAVRGTDFTGRTDTFLQIVRQRAIGRGVSLHIEVSDDGSIVDVVMTPRVSQNDIDLFGV
jgi:hypothetical protein